MTEKKSFWNKLKEKVSRAIPDPVKRGFKRFGIIASFMTLGTMGANAAPAPSPLADSVGKDIINNINIRPSESELRTICEAYANSATIQHYYQEYLDSVMAETGEAILQSDSTIQAQMRHKNGRIVLASSMGNKALGGSFGNTSKNPTWRLHCGWAGMRGLYLGMKKAGTEDFFSNSLEILSTANMSTANFGYQTFAHSDLLHISRTQKKLGLKGIGIKENKQALLNEIKQHPNDIILIGIRNHHRGGSGHHFVKIAGGKLISYNREKITDPISYIQNFKDIGWWINLSEYERQNQNKSQISAELAQQIYIAAQKHLENKTFPTYFAKIINNPETTVAHKNALTQISTSIVMTDQIDNKEGNKLIHNVVAKLDSQAIKHLKEVISSNQISAQRKIEITSMFQDMVNIPTATEIKDTTLTEEQIFKTWSQESAETLQAASKDVQSHQTMSLEEKQLYMSTLAELWQPIKMAQTYSQTEQLQEQTQSLQNLQKIKQLTQKKTSWRKTKKATKMAMKRARIELAKNKSLADVMKQNRSNGQLAKQRPQASRTLGG